MSDFKDPRITQYLLNEMSQQEKLKFEDEIKADAKLQEIIDELSPIYTTLNEELPKETMPAGHVNTELDLVSRIKKYFLVLTPIAAVAGLAVAFILPELTTTKHGDIAIKRNINRPHIVEPKGASEAKSAPSKLAAKPAPGNKQINSVKPSIASPSAVSPSHDVVMADMELMAEEVFVPQKTKKIINAKNRNSFGNISGASGYANIKGKSIPGHYFNPGSRLLPPGSLSAESAESYDKIKPNSFVKVLTEALSTFSIDVDTASYSNIRRFLKRNQKPPVDAVRIEEMINYFSYNYKAPTGKAPFSVNTEMTTAPWNKKHHLLRIGLQGKDINWKDRKASNLVFLLDVSGSMSDANKLPLVKQGLKLMVENLNAKDRVAIVVYAGASGLVLPSTKGSDKEEILAAFDRLSAGGSTNGGDGINLAYKVAKDNFIKDGVNRVILATDGDFNVGTTSRQSLDELIKEKAKSKVFLSVLGFGSGNLQDSQMESLANKGNGNYAYIDSYKEAKKVLVEQIGGTMMTIAKDVKIQVEFNPANVEAYRLIGYENRKLNKEDFNDDKKDAGEIGAGHSVTALYEIVPKGQAVPSPKVDDLKYQKPVVKKGLVNSDFVKSDEWLTVKLRYKEPTGSKSSKIEFPVKEVVSAFDAASQDTRFAVSVAGFGMLLRDSQFSGDLTLKQIRQIAVKAKGLDKKEYRSEFIELIDKAIKINLKKD